MPRMPSMAGLFVGTLLAGCATSAEQSARTEFRAQAAVFAPPMASRTSTASGALSASDQVGPVDGRLASHLKAALSQSPGLRADFERWQAAVHRISRGRRLPKPELRFGYYLRAVETRVGPQRARLGLSMAFPWPTALSAGSEAGAAEARAAQRRFEAHALTVGRRVREAYWELWRLRRTRAIHEDHLEVVRGLSETVRARMATGAAVLAELQQIDLTAARLEDSIVGMTEAERVVQSRLRAEVGAMSADLATTDEPPPVGLPAASEAQLAAQAAEHPGVEAWAAQADAARARARRHDADRWPGFSVGLDWVVTGQARTANVDRSGQDAVFLQAGLRLPAWQSSYIDDVRAAQAEARARVAQGRARHVRGVEQVQVSLSKVRDAARRVRLYRETLVPQAESAYESVLGVYTVGRGSVAQTLLSQRDLLELRVELERARTEHAQAWARLEEAVGAPVATAEGESP